MARTRYRICTSKAPYFLTATLVNWRPLFGRPVCAEIVLESLRFLHEAEDGWTLYAYVIMENHLHWIVHSEALPDVVRRFKSYTARRIVDHLCEAGAESAVRITPHRALQPADRQQHRVWRRDNQPKAIQGERMFWQKVRYIHNNPVQRGYVTDPLHWRYSSASSYAGGEGLIPVTVPNSFADGEP